MSHLTENVDVSAKKCCLHRNAAACGGRGIKRKEKGDSAVIEIEIFFYFSLQLIFFVSCLWIDPSIARAAACMTS